MDTEEALYAAVSEEISRGQIRKGLWAKALAEEGYDDVRAKARYLKLRVRALRSELFEAVSAERTLQREEQRQQHAEAIESRFRDLGYRTASLARLRKTRRIIQFLGFWVPFLGTTILAFPHVATDNVERAFLAIGAGFLVGMATLLITELARRLIPSQRHLEREEIAIRQQHESLERARMSWLARLASDIWNLLISLAVIAYIVALVVRHFAE